MIHFNELKEAVLHLLFPQLCAGCGNELPAKEHQLCITCMAALPETLFERHADNPVEKKFLGRLPFHSATAHYYFTRESLIQKLMHQFKYSGNKELGFQLGQLMGQGLKMAGRFQADFLVPLPLFARKEKKRGYNQATVLCEGMAASMQIPVLKQAVIRTQHTDTQTQKGRVERWQNMEGKFLLQQPELVEGKHLLLVDDVVTTGATLEACGTALLKAGNVKLSIATLCYASR